MFCKICGSVLVPKKTEYGSWMSCPHGHLQPELNQDKKVVKLDEMNRSKKIEILEEKNHLAVHHHICKKCGYDQAELIEISCSYTDEDNIYRMKCGKCGFIEQLEGKVT